VLAAGALVLSLTACGGGGGGNPSGGNPVATPTPTPAPAPTPTPPPPPGAVCSLGLGTGSGENCPQESPSFENEVEAAIDKLVAEQPDIFDLNNQRGAGGYYIRSLGRFYVGVITNLEGMGLCAAFDGEELQVKANNDFNDQYDVELATGHLRRGPSAYRSTCYPASFPKPYQQPGQTPGCSLPGSREVACSREDGASRYLDSVEAALDTVIQTRPELFDLGDTAPSTNWPKVLDVDAYVTAVIKVLSNEGFCAIWDGEEMAVKKDSNDVSEQFDILLASNHIRRDDGSYRASCYPAAF
jgi:hypothetical protein